MNPPTHHLPESLMMDYVVGALDEALSLLVATHLSLCPQCRAQVRALEEMGGALLDDITGEEPDPEVGWQALLERLDEPVPGPPLPPAPTDPFLRRFPEPLRSYLPRDRRGRLEWSLKLPGVGQVRLPVEHRGYGVVVNMLSGGLAVPRHTHEGQEYNLVLAGGFTDGGLDYVRGDLAVAGPDVVHRLSIHRGEPCILLSVMENPLVPMSPAAKILSRLLPA
ncbi:MAG: ChrR family anti-sigma-E factor [Myxococcota bacterium]